MDGIPVTLIVKAPNQQIEDQTIQCELSWTIKKLKGYLSEVYPSKPKTEEQKLIYSGQLLSDSVVLKDILRRYEGQETHTVHLVCAPRKDMFKSSVNKIQNNDNNMKEHPSTSSNTSINNRSNNLNSTQSTSSPVNTTTATNSCNNVYSRVTSNGEPSTSRLTTTSSVSKPNEMDSRPSFVNTSAFTTLNSPNGNNDPVELPQIYNFDSQQYAAQLAMFQHNYMNYLNQYMQLYANQMQNLTERRMPTTSMPEMENEQQRVAPVEPAAARVGAEPAAAMPVPNVNVAEGDEAIADRDWLDWFYVLSRLTMLFSIVYFYSSPLRFIFVLFLGCAMYLYQIGFFRNHLENNNGIINNNVPLPAENNNNQRNVNDDGGEQQPLAAQGQVAGGGNVNQPRELNNNPNNNMQQQPNNIDMIPDRPTVLGVMWTFFTTFFASLIPEIPNAI